MVWGLWGGGGGAPLFGIGISWEIVGMALGQMMMTSFKGWLVSQIALTSGSAVIIT